jgi:endonuclease/exonuclease/phosphatase (EEP) superfamily protein YafD
LSTVVPMFVRDQRPATTPPFTLISLNMLNGQADPAGLARQAQQADIVVLIEATPFGVNRLERYDWSREFPYSAGATRQDTTGSVIYSRFPLSDSAALPTSSFLQWAATADVPEVGPVRILAVHPCNPYCGGDRWASEHEDLRAAVAAQRSDVPLIVAGDFNAINDHGPMMALRADGLRSATDIAGAGWLPTYPANRRVPPLIPIDHVYINDRLTATAAGTFRVGGTDHFGLQVRLAGTQ